jgi:hypothetical protein
MYTDLSKCDVLYKYIYMKFSGLIYVLRFIYPNLEPALMPDNT